MLDYDWCDLDFAPLPVFDSESESELIDDESDTIFECKKQCILYDELHWLNDLDELDKTLDDYKVAQSTESTKVITQQINAHNSTSTQKSSFSSEEYYIFQQPCKVPTTYKYKRKKPVVTKASRA